MSGEDLKTQVAERAAQLLLERWRDGTVRVLGLGTGSTAERFLERVAQLYKEGRLPGLIGVPTSLRTGRFARTRGLLLAALEEHLDVDLTVDGADEVDAQLNALKGGGGAHTREKIVASASREYWLIVDESKLVKRLSEKCPVPVEVLPFGWKFVQRELKKLGAEPILRRLPNEKPFLTDNGHYVLDARFPGGLQDPGAIAQAIKALPGVVEHGLFLGMANRVIVAGQQTGVRVLERE